MEDYTSNAKKNKEPKPEKNIQKVIAGDVIIPKKSLVKKFKDTFIKDSLHGVIRYVISDIIIPETINMFVDASTKAIGRIAYGERGANRRQFGSVTLGGQRQYQTPVSRALSPIRDNLDRTGLPPRAALSPVSRHIGPDFILATRADAAAVLEKMIDIIDTYEVVSVADLNAMLEIESTPYTDNKWGWVDLRNVQIVQVRDGWLIDLPQPEPIQ